MDHGGWYDLQTKDFRNIVDVQFVAAMGPPGGGRTFITSRYLRHFNLIALTEFSGDSLTRIFSTILTYFLAPFPRELQKMTEPIVASTLQLYDTVAQQLLPTPTKSHYVFNLRDLSKVVQGIMQATPASCPDSDQLVKLWHHECSRVFRDRLVDEPDRFWFDKFMAESVTSVRTSPSASNLYYA